MSAAVELIRPPEFIDSFEQKTVIYLAGPVQGTWDWQQDAFTRIAAGIKRMGRAIEKPIDVASPRRYGVWNEDMWEDQYRWENRFMAAAHQFGCLLFWLAREREPVPGRSYAQCTRYELGKWLQHHRANRPAIVVGMEPGFSGERYIMAECMKYKVPLMKTLEETCQKAVVYTYFQREPDGPQLLNSMAGNVAEAYRELLTALMPPNSLANWLERYGEPAKANDMADYYDATAPKHSHEYNNAVAHAARHALNIR